MKMRKENIFFYLFDKGIFLLFISLFILFIFFKKRLKRENYIPLLIIIFLQKNKLLIVSFINHSIEIRKKYLFLKDFSLLVNDIFLLLTFF